jgi:uncharacterized membrane protein (Fun14 family)
MDSIMTYIGPIIQQLGFGGIMGFCVGYASKKIAKTAVILIGIIFICIQFLAYYGWVEPHWDKAAHAVEQGAQSGVFESAFSSCMRVLVKNLPFGAAFIGGFWLGMKKG